MLIEAVLNEHEGKDIELAAVERVYSKSANECYDQDGFGISSPPLVQIITGFP